MQLVKMYHNSDVLGLQISTQRAVNSFSVYKLHWAFHTIWAFFVLKYKLILLRVFLEKNETISRSKIVTFVPIEFLTMQAFLVRELSMMNFRVNIILRSLTFALYNICHYETESRLWSWEVNTFQYKNNSASDSIQYFLWTHSLFSNDFAHLNDLRHHLIK